MEESSRPVSSVNHLAVSTTAQHLAACVCEEAHCIDCSSMTLQVAGHTVMYLLATSMQASCRNRKQAWALTGTGPAKWLSPTPASHAMQTTTVLDALCTQA